MDVEGYIGDAAKERQSALKELRQMVKKLFPKIVETMDYRMPTYVLDGETLCCFASQKRYLAFYVMPYDLLDAFKDDLAEYDCGKSCIRFKSIGKSEIALLKKITKHCGTHYSESKYFGKMNAKMKK